MDAVAARLGTDVDDRISGAGRARIEDAVGARQAHGHRVDQDVAIVARVEFALARHGWDAHAVAVTADA